MNDNTTMLLTRAAHFAAIKHTKCRRKGEQQEPYFNHLSDVAQILAEHTGGADPVLIAAGFLHDTIEDTETTYDELVQTFGTEVADLVREVTDDKVPKAERKRLQIENAPHKSPRARMIKIADKISNLKSIQTSPPADWTEERKREYFEWAGKVVAGCKGAHAELENTFEKVFKEGW